ILRVEVLWIPVLERYRFQAAVEMIGPAVIAALEFAGVALVRSHHHRTAMGTLIVQDPNASASITHHEHRLPAHLRSKIVGNVPDLALVPDIDPGFAEDAFEFELKYCGVGVKAAMDTGRPYKLQESIGRMLLHLAPPRKPSASLRRY